MPFSCWAYLLHCLWWHIPCISVVMKNFIIIRPFGGKIKLIKKYGLRKLINYSNKYNNIKKIIFSCSKIKQLEEILKISNAKKILWYFVYPYFFTITVIFQHHQPSRGMAKRRNLSITNSGLTRLRSSFSRDIRIFQ